MKYREYDGVEFRIVTAQSREEFQKNLEELGREYDFLDIQYSDGRTQYSALAIIRKKAKKGEKKEARK